MRIYSYTSGLPALRAGFFIIIQIDSLDIKMYFSEFIKFYYHFKNYLSKL